jgi:ribosomal protein L14E/L6E/L27E
MGLNAVRFSIGDIVQSKAGHDMDRVYVVVGAGDEFSTLCDGEYRPLNKTKNKRNKHLRFLAAGEITGKPTDVKIKKLIKDWRSHAQRG